MFNHNIKKRRATLEKTQGLSISQHLALTDCQTCVSAKRLLPTTWARLLLSVLSPGSRKPPEEQGGNKKGCCYGQVHK